MKTQRSIVLTLLAFLVTVGLEYGYARGGGTGKSSGTQSSSSSGGKVHVSAYSRKDGTPVKAHDRSYPGSGSGLTASGDIYRVSTSGGYTAHTAHYSTGYLGARDENGRIVRSESAKLEFMQMTGYPHGRPGYVVDHLVALKRGGADAPSNMQWQTIAEAKAKDKWE